MRLDAVVSAPELLALFLTLLLACGALRAMGLPWRLALFPLWLVLGAVLLLLAVMILGLTLWARSGATIT